MATVTQKITADEFLKMDLGDGLHELVKGEIVEMPPPSPKHGMVCMNVGAIFHGFGRETGLGYALCNDSVVVIDKFNVRGADVQYFSEARWPKAKVGDAPPPIAPDLVVEVRSPSDRWADVLAKVVDYLHSGVPVVLVLQPKPRSLMIFRDDGDPITLGESDALENLPELPGFRCLVADFFA